MSPADPLTPPDALHALRMSLATTEDIINTILQERDHARSERDAMRTRLMNALHHLRVSRRHAMELAKKLENKP